MGAAFLNWIRIGPANQNFSINVGGGAVAKTVPSGLYTYWELRNAFQLQAQGTAATFRSGIDSDGFWQFDVTVGTFAIVWTDTALRDLLGWTTDIAAGTSSKAPRRMRGAFHVSPATIREHYPLPRYAVARETVSIGGVTRADTSVVQYDETTFEIQFIDALARYVSQSGADATTYANAAATATGLTAWHHARDCWYPASDVASQGWSDGRPVMFFEDATDSAIALSVGAASEPSDYTTWQFTDKARESFASQKERPPRNVHHRLTLPAREYVAPV